MAAARVSLSSAAGTPEEPCLQATMVEQQLPNAGQASGDFATVWVKARPPKRSTSDKDLKPGLYEVDAKKTARHNLRCGPNAGAAAVGLLLGGDIVDVAEVRQVSCEAENVDVVTPSGVSGSAELWGQLARQGHRDGKRRGVWVLIYDRHQCQYLKYVGPRQVDMPDAALDVITTDSRPEVPTQVRGSAVWPGEEAARNDAAIAMVLSDPAAELMMVREAYNHMMVCALEGGKAERVISLADKLEGQVKSMRAENEARRRIAPFVAEQRHSELQRWGAWQSQIMSLDMARLHSLEHLQAHTQAADRELEVQLRRLQGLRRAPDKAFDIDLAQSLASMESQCYSNMLSH